MPAKWIARECERCNLAPKLNRRIVSDTNIAVDMTDGLFILDQKYKRFIIKRKKGIVFLLDR